MSGGLSQQGDPGSYISWAQVWRGGRIPQTGVTAWGLEPYEVLASLPRFPWPPVLKHAMEVAERELAGPEEPSKVKLPVWTEA